MLSMTGFGEGRAAGEAGEARVQVASVNHRALQVTVRGELRDLALEEEVRGAVRAGLGRGAVTVQIAWLPRLAGGVDAARLAETWRQLAAVAAGCGAPVPSLADALRLLPTGGGGEAEAAAPLVRAALAQALERVQAAREREGAATRGACQMHAAALRALLPRLRTAAAARLPAWREALRRRVEEAVAQALPADVLAREVALLADRGDVAEELDRLAAHCDALDALLAATDGEPAGRRLEFLTQELHRELSTTGSKANDAALGALAMEGKLAVEQLKEQAANIS